jgi:hypothetical protein
MATLVKKPAVKYNSQEERAKTVLNEKCFAPVWQSPKQKGSRSADRESSAGR